MKYDILLIDADDTLFDFRACEKEAFYKAYTESGYECNDEIYAEYSQINLSMWKMLERGEIDKARLKVERFEKLFSNHGIKGDAQALCSLYGRCLSECHTLIPGAKKFLEQVNKTCRVYIITNGIAETQEKRFRDSGIDGLVDGVFISEKIGANKPSEAFFNHVMSKIPDFDISRAIVFGDSLTSDIKGAANAGIASCLFNPDGKDIITDIRPTFTAETYCDFLKIIVE